jgi:GlpG protein
MRHIGTLADEQQALRLAAYLFNLGIRSQLDPEAGGIAVWALDEDRIPQAREEFQRFIQDPDNLRYAEAETGARELLAQQQQQERERQRNVIRLKRQWHASNMKGLTFVMIVLSCAAGFANNFGEDITSASWQGLLIDSSLRQGDFLIPKPRFSPMWDVFHGQVWRLITPIFLHVGPVHLLMNMMALHNIGKLIELRFGTRTLGLIVLLTALVSNLSQYAWNGPNFAGMSGVVFGLFGYIWMKSEFDPQAGFKINRNSVFWILGWMVLCFTGWIGPIANAAHLMGLVTGMALGYGPVLARRLMRR